MKSPLWVGSLTFLILLTGCSDDKTGTGTTTGNLTVAEQTVAPFVGDWDVSFGQANGRISVSKNQVEIDFTGDALIGQVVTQKVVVDVNNPPKVPVDTDIGTINVTATKNSNRLGTRAVDEAGTEDSYNFSGTVTRADGNNASFSGQFSRLSVFGNWQALVSGQTYSGNISANRTTSPGEGRGEACSSEDFAGTWQGTYRCSNSCTGQDFGGAITLNISVNGNSATYTDGTDSFAGTISGCRFTFEKTNNLDNSTENGTLMLNSSSSATKNSTWYSIPGDCGGHCTDHVTKVN